MKILIYSPFFLPKIGGLENMAAMLATEFQALGEDIKVITYTKDNGNEINLPYEVYRNPSTFELLKLVKWCNIFFQPNISLKGIWPFLFFRRKYVVSHQTQNYQLDGSITYAGQIKQFVSRFALNICCSNYIAKLLPGSAITIPNCYDADTFKNFEKDRPFELIFVGRLVSDKGCNLIIEALAELRKENIYPKLTVVGIGPENDNLKKLTINYDLTNQVNFIGAKTGKVLVEEINKHQVMIVPSIWQEPFGIVALEGLACGCKMIVANVGGLPEAIGNHGLLFKENNIADLKDKIKISLKINQTDTVELKKFLSNHHPKNTAKAYLLAISTF